MHKIHLLKLLESTVFCGKLPKSKTNDISLVSCEKCLEIYSASLKRKENKKPKRKAPNTKFAVHSKKGEIWKPFTSKIEASNFGRFRIIKTKHRCKLRLHKKTFNPVVATTDTNAARVIYRLFKDSNLKLRDIVRFVDRNPLNLHVDNLYIQKYGEIIT